MLCEQVLGKLHDFDTTGKTIEYVDIEWHEAFKKIHKKTTDKGTEVGIRMDDSILARGLYQDDGEFDEILKDVMNRSEEDLCLSAPGFDIRGIQHEKLYSRLYMS